MKKIIKGKEPNSLTEHKKKDHASYDNYREKSDLRASLVRDQRGICCYCMSGITMGTESMKIEHWQCQKDYPERQLDYSNLLGSCKGNEGQAQEFQHCDTFKGQSSLSKNPAEKLVNIEDTIQYLGDGTIKSSDPIFNNEIDSILNLNTPYLINSRKAVLDGFKQTLQKKGKLKNPTIKRWIKEWNGDDRSSTDTLKPFCQVVVYWLRKRLRKS